MESIRSEKQYGTAVCLAFIFGIMGIHHFYLGRYLIGILDFSMFLITVFLFFNDYFAFAYAVFAVDYVHSLVVIIMLLIGVYKDGEGKIITYPGQKLKSETVKKI